jgi:hypothetical protein
VAIERRLVEFSDDDLDEVVAAVRALRDGEWINVEPYVDQADLDELRARTPSALVRIFSKAGGPIPLGTIARTGSVLSVGLEHPYAARAIPFLREHDVAPPAEWKLKQDHARRGLVFEAPADTDPQALLRWILRAGKLLGTVRIGREWTALVCTPGRR